MIRLGLLLLGLAVLVGCGVDGEPVRPSAGASVGVGTGGVSTGVSAGATIGRVGVGVGVWQ